MKISLSTRDLINIAIFAVIDFVFFYICGMVGFIGPAFMFVGWAVGIIGGGVIIALLVSRVPKLGALTLTGFIIGLGMAPGHTIWIIPVGLVIWFIADLIATEGGRATRVRPTNFIVAYAVTQIWMIVPLLPMVFNSDSYYEQVSEQMGDSYANDMQALFSVPVLVGWGITVVILGIIGGWFGVRMSRKHFERAGLAR
ncbi:MptD family putative ECF transporter S component [Corynebacterium pseudokroppenstedtii]|uniref:MptD family putative ECF transporter S component n=1 Tax=Corynebacterium pseudokroppenstedtii TaxID=2804917 RepID=A0AAU0PZ26_9CORY|nr:MptD family putative ECF transporter S component [Corynebacterium pseudokroppenstedtii]MDU6478878.1 MptD family putative ECF transporter S component [Corynebacterium kroppenstedtii]MBY0791507.1 MptD family putative ECF transporter S component [Corynebacterium pseudokroppenstedtii]MCF6793957.1 MptD family putative ECF transporter S component [Corynebacterium pseudokroppenstedtii]MCF8703522.1 MptD family putative ECF transporter S component [Corynebacterium pseudokroppenstedtii]MCG2636945.1 M